MCLPHGTCAKALVDERINPMAGSRLLIVNNVPERLVEYPIRLSHGLCMHSQTLGLLIRFFSAAITLDVPNLKVDWAVLLLLFLLHFLRWAHLRCGLICF